MDSAHKEDIVKEAERCGDKGSNVSGLARFLGVMRGERALATEQFQARRAGLKPRAVAKDDGYRPE